MAYKMFVFDFDGTLVDSYTCLPDVYASIANRVGLQGENSSKFVNEMVQSEDQQDAIGNYHRHEWWPSVLEQFGIHVSEKQLIQLIGMYWEQRTIKSKVRDHIEETLRWLKARGILTMVCRGDGKYGNKKERIKKSGIREFFDRLVVIGEQTDSITQALEFLTREYGINGDEMMFFDDIPSAISEISENIPIVTTVRVKFEGILRLAWAQHCTPDYSIDSINEIKRIVD